MPSSEFYLGVLKVPNLISKCGIDCGTCPWGPYPRKDMSINDFEHFRNSAKRILGYMPIKSPCVMCQTPDTDIPQKTKLPNRKCLIRQCVDKSGITNCAYCSRFPCDTLKATSGLWTRENIEQKLGSQISEEEYTIFVKPFEGISRLNAIRNSLESEQIGEPAKAPKSKISIVEFPENLSFSKGQLASFKSVHKLLASLVRSSLGLTNTDTFAQYYKLEGLRANIFRFLWIIGNYGRFTKEKKPHLEIDGATYEANRGNQKTLAIWPFVRNTVFKILSEFGVCCERMVLKGVKEEDIVTGTGYLRREGWTMAMFFEEKIGGTAALDSLQEYAHRLDTAHGKKAFQHFQNADMQVLLDEKP